MGFEFSIARIAAQAVALAAVLGSAGCATYDSYYDDGYSYRSEGTTYREPYTSSYSGGGDYYYAEPSYGYDIYDADPYSYGYNAYYSTLWPTYSRYYDPWYSPYYYGVTYFPRSWYGYSLSYRSDPWGYYGYSPYRYGYWNRRYRDRDNYARREWRPDRADDNDRYGRAADEADRMARRRDLDRTSGGRAYSGGAGYSGGYRGDGALGSRTRGFGVPVDPAPSGAQGPSQRGDWSRERDGSRPRYSQPSNRESGRVTALPGLGYDDRATGWRETDPSRGDVDRTRELAPTYRSRSTDTLDAYRSRSIDRDRSYDRGRPSYAEQQRSFSREATPQRYEVPSRTYGRDGGIDAGYQPRNDAPRVEPRSYAPPAQPSGGGWSRGRDGGGSVGRDSGPSFSAPSVDRGDRGGGRAASELGSMRSRQGGDRDGNQPE